MTTAVGLCEFCRNPLHPGPCAHWRNPLATKKRPKVTREGEQVTRRLRHASQEDMTRVTATMHETYDYADPDTGLETRVSEVKREPDGEVSVHILIADRAGVVVGQAHRVIGPGQGVPVSGGGARLTRELQVYHARFELDPNVQGGGFARRWNEQVYQAYAEMGVGRVGLMADEDVGGYAWATDGYDFERHEDLHDIASYFELLLARPDVSPETKAEVRDLLARSTRHDFRRGTHPTPFEFAMVGREEPFTVTRRGRPRTSWWGQERLLGMSWNGVRPITVAARKRGEVPFLPGGEPAHPVTAAAKEQDAHAERDEFLLAVSALGLAYADEIADEVPAIPEHATQPRSDYAIHHHLISADPEQTEILLDDAEGLLDEWGRGRQSERMPDVDGGMTAAVKGHMPEKLAEYWVHGKGALKIRWGMPGDFKRCVRHLRKYFPRNPEGLCNRLHTRALGVPPGQEHKGHHTLFALMWRDDRADWDDGEEFRDVSTQERKRLAEGGKAMPDGSYPIANVDDLKNAIRAIGRAKESDRAAVRRHIMRRARELDAADLIPEEWRKRKAEHALEEMAAERPDLDDFDEDDDEMAYAEEAELVPTKSMWRGTLAPLGVPTGDRRKFAPGGIGHRDLPLPLLFQKQTGEGHAAATIVGRVLGIEPRDNEMYGYGDWLNVPEADEARELLRNGVIGPSVDLDDVSYELRIPGTDDEWKPAEQCSEESGQCSAHEFVVTKGRIAGVTLVAIPAFAEAKLELYDGPDEEGLMEAFDAMPEVEAAPACGCGMTAAAIGAYVTPVRGLVAAPTTSFTPPRLLFELPESDVLHGLRLGEHLGYTSIFGHLAGWDIPHLSHRVRTPRSPSGYAYFHLGRVYTAEGDELAVGKITYAGPHASEEVGLLDAIRHYDDTSRAVAVGRASDGKHGVWFSGVLLPGVDEATRLALEIHQPSGDWRYVGRDLELVAALIVNVPAFPVTRIHETDGRVTALVACAGLNIVDRLVAERVEARLAEIAHDERVVHAGRLRVQFLAAQQQELADALGLSEG